MARLLSCWNHDLKCSPMFIFLSFCAFIFFGCCLAQKKPKAWKTDTAPYTGVLGSQRGSNHDVKNNEYLFSQFIPHAFESEVLLFKKERIIRSKEREDNVSDHFANQKKWHSQKEDVLSYDRLRVFQRKNKKQTQRKLWFQQFSVKLLGPWGSAEGYVRSEHTEHLWISSL